MIIKYDTSNGTGTKFDYVKDGDVIACSCGPNKKTDAEVEAEFGDTVQRFEDNAGLVAEKANHDLTVIESNWIADQLPIISSEIEDAEDAGSDSTILRAYRLAIKKWPSHADYPDATKRPAL